MTRGEHAVISCSRADAAAPDSASLVPSPPATSDRVELELTLESMIQVQRVHFLCCWCEEELAVGAAAPSDAIMLLWCCCCLAPQRPHQVRAWLRVCGPGRERVLRACDTSQADAFFAAESAQVHCSEALPWPAT